MEWIYTLESSTSFHHHLWKIFPVSNLFIFNLHTSIHMCHFVAEPVHNFILFIFQSRLRQHRVVLSLILFVAFEPLANFKIPVFEYHRDVHAVSIVTCKLRDFWLANNTIKHNIIKRPLCTHGQCVYVSVIFKRTAYSSRI